MKVALWKLLQSSIRTIVRHSRIATENSLVWFWKRKCLVNTEKLLQFPGTLPSRRQATVLSQLGSLQWRIPRNPDEDINAEELYSIYAQPIEIFFFFTSWAVRICNSKLLTRIRGSGRYVSVEQFPRAYAHSYHSLGRASSYLVLCPLCALNPINICHQRSFFHIQRRHNLHFLDDSHFRLLTPHRIAYYVKNLPMPKTDILGETLKILFRYLI